MFLKYHIAIILLCSVPWIGWAQDYEFQGEFFDLLEDLEKQEAPTSPFQRPLQIEPHEEQATTPSARFVEQWLTQEMLESLRQGNPIVVQQKIDRIMAEINRYGPKESLLIQLGDLMIGEKRFEQALWHFYQAIEVYPYSAEAWERFAFCFLLAGDHERGYLLYKQLNRQPAIQERALPNLGAAAYNLKRYSEAATIHYALVQQRPDQWEDWYNLGAALLQINNSTNAIKAFKQASQLNSQELIPLIGIVQAYQQLNQPQKTQGLQQQIKARINNPQTYEKRISQQTLPAVLQKGTGLRNKTLATNHTLNAKGFLQDYLAYQWVTRSKELNTIEKERLLRQILFLDPYQGWALQQLYKNYEERNEPIMGNILALTMQKRLPKDPFWTSQKTEPATPSTKPETMPDDLNKGLQKAIKLAISNELRNAELDTRKLLQQYPEHWEPLIFNLAEIYRLMNQQEFALMCARYLLFQVPDQAQYALFLIDLLQRFEKKDEAKNLIHALHQENPENPLFKNLMEALEEPNPQNQAPSEDATPKGNPQ